MARNVVSIFVDDLLAVEPVRTLFGVTLETPNLDRLAAAGVSFDNAFAAVAQCSPARATLLTGQSPFTTGIHINNDPVLERIDLAATLPGLFRAAGYLTANFGKVFHSLDPDDARAVFDVFVDHKRDGEPTVEGRTADALNVRAAIGFMAEHAGERSLTMLGLHDPHAPKLSPERYRIYDPDDIVLPDLTQDDLPRFIRDYLSAGDKSPETLRAGVASYFANITEMDARLGEILDAIAATPGERPIVMLVSDHGFHAGGDHDHTGKFTLYDGAARFPFVVVDPDAPDAVRGTRHAGVVAAADVAPTVLELAGLDVPGTMQGRSLVAALAAPEESRAGVAITSLWGSLSLAVDRGETQWRYTRYENGEQELFRASDDPFNVDNLAAEPRYEGRLQQLRTLLERELAKVGVAIDEAHDVVSVDAGAGDSTYFITATSDLAAIRDDGGYDVVYTAKRHFTLPDGVEAVTIAGSKADGAAGFRIGGNAGDNLLVGGRGHSRDVLQGAGGDDAIDGGNGADLIRGGRGDDTLHGGTGDDVVIAGPGDDVVIEQGGSDVLLFRHERRGTDQVFDFNPRGDVIRLAGEAWRDGSVEEVGRDAVISAGEHSIVLVDAARYDLTLSDFELVA